MDDRAAAYFEGDASAVLRSGATVPDAAIPDRDCAFVPDEDSAAAVRGTVDDRKALDHALERLPVEQQERPALPLAIDGAVVRSVLAANGDDLAAEVDVTIALAGVRAVCDQNRAPFFHDDDARLDGGLIGRHPDGVRRGRERWETHHQSEEQVLRNFPILDLE